MEDGKNETADVGFLDAVSGDGTHDVKTNAPMLKILHFTSPEVLPGDAHVKDAVAGAFVNTATKRVYGNRIEVIPIKAVNCWLEYAPKDKGGGFRGRHAVGSIPVIGDLYTRAYTKDGNEIIEALEFYCLVKDEMEQGIVLLSLTGSNIRHGKTWASRISVVKLPDKVYAKGDVVTSPCYANGKQYKVGDAVDTGFIVPGKVQPFYGSWWKLTTALNQNAKGQQWYALGVNKATNAERIAFINEIEYVGYVAPAVEFAKMFSIAASAGGTLAIAAPEETEY